MNQSKGKSKDKQPKEHISEKRKQYIVTKITRQKMSMREAEERFSVPRSTLCNWKKASMNGKPLMGRGRPKLVDDKALEYIKNEVKKDYHANSTTPAGKTTVDGQRNAENIISQAIHDTAKRNNRVFQGDGIDRKTRNSILNRADLQIVGTEQTTNPRALASTSIYMGSSTIALFNSIGKMGVNPALLINADCTRVDHTLNSDGKKGKGVVPKESVRTLKRRSAKTSADSTKKDYVGIRWFPCANMYGDMGPVVLIIADENMHADTIDVHEVRTLVNHGNNICGYESGYVVFLKTTPGKKFFEWYVSEIVVDFVRRLKIAYEFKDDATAFLVHDGEYCQINTWMTDTNELAEMFKTLHIAVGKLGASTTGVSQPLDAGKLFCSVRQAVKKQHIDGDHLRGLDALKRGIEKVIEAHITASGGQKVHNKKRIIVFGLLGSHVAINKYATRPMGAKSFMEAGLQIMSDGIVCDVIQVLQQYKQWELISGDKDHKLALYVDQCRDLTDKFISGGGLSDAFMYEKLDLVKELHEYVHQNDLDRDKRALTNQRCVIIVTPALTAKQERLKKNEEERKKAEEEKAKKLLEHKKRLDEAVSRSKEEKKAALSAKDAEIKKAMKENKELLQKIASLEAQVRSKTEQTPQSSARKRKSSTASTSSASDLQCSQAWEDVLNTITRTRESSVVENLGANRKPGKRSIKRKLH